MHLAAAILVYASTTEIRVVIVITQYEFIGSGA